MSDTESLASAPVLEGGTSRLPAPAEQGEQVSRKTGDKPGSYYDIPMLKEPTWSWEIASYFFLGGLSGAAYLLARVANRMGGEKFRDVTKAGTLASAIAFLPCAPLLIKDLGDPKRFLFMLRTFKPKSPMSLGSWILSGFGGVLSLTALLEWRRTRRGSKAITDTVGRQAAQVVKQASGPAEAVLDTAGIPLGLGLIGYTGVLLSTTATPLWARNRWLGPLFTAGAISSGAAAINLVRETSDKHASHSASQKPMKKIAMAGKLAEAITLGGFLTEAGDRADPVTRGKYAPHLWGGAVGTGLVLSTLLENLPVKSKKTQRRLRIAGAVLGLAGGFALRWAISQAGHPSAANPEDARKPGK